MAEVKKGKEFFKLTYDHLRLIAKDIFGDSPSVAIREIIQNAHDAILIRAAQTKEDGEDQGWAVRIVLNPDKKTITIIDDGVGMTLQEIMSDLTVLGASPKKNLEERYEDILSSDKLENVVGVFGYGFVASLIVSKEIELWTKSVKSNTKGIYCRFGRSEEYEYDEQDISEPGTKIVLHIDAKVAEITEDKEDIYSGEIARSLKGGNILNIDTIKAIVQKYCDLLEYDIRVGLEGLDEVVVNLKQAPWEVEEYPSMQQYLQFFKRRVGQDVNEPLFYIPFFSTHEEDKIKASGVLYVPDPGARRREEIGFLDIFVKRMWVCEEEIDLLPRWASFLKGVIISPDLVPRMDRHKLDRNHVSYHRLKKALDKTIYEYFKDLSINKTETFREFLNPYGESFKRGLGIEWHEKHEREEGFIYDELLRNIPFRAYSQKQMGGKLTTINSYMGLDPKQAMIRTGKEKNKIYAVGRMIPLDKQGELRKLISQKSYPVIVPETGGDLLLLAILGEVFNKYLDVVDIETRLMKDFMDLLKREEKERWDLFVEYFKFWAKDHRIPEVNVGNIPITDLPAMIADIPQEAEEEQEKEEKKESLEAAIAEKHRKAVIINAKNRLMQNLLAYCEENKLERLDFLVESCLHQCFHMAVKEHLGGDITPILLTHCFQTQMEFMEKTIEKQKEYDERQRGYDKLSLQSSEVDSELKKYRSIFGEVDFDKIIKVPDKPEPRWCAIIITDIDSSTTTLSNLDFEDRGDIFSQYVQTLKSHIIDCGGFFDKFTGDGFIALFGVDMEGEPSLEEAQRFCKDAEMCAEEIQIITKKFCEQENIRKKLDQEGLGNFLCRTAISYGKVAFGKFGSTGSVVGKAIVEATRICSEKRFFESSRRLVVSEDFFKKLGQVPGREFKLIEENYQLKGLSRKINVYGI